MWFGLCAVPILLCTLFLSSLLYILDFSYPQDLCMLLKYFLAIWNLAILFLCINRGLYVAGSSCRQWSFTNPHLTPKEWFWSVRQMFEHFFCYGKNSTLISCDLLVCLWFVNSPVLSRDFSLKEFLTVDFCKPKVCPMSLTIVFLLGLFDIHSTAKDV